MVKCVTLLKFNEKRFGDGNKEILFWLLLQLLLIIYNGPILNDDKLLIIFNSYYELSQFDWINTLL